MTVQSQEQQRMHPFHPISNEREQLVQLVRRWGSSTTDAILDPHCSFFCTPSVEGGIGYRIVSNCIIALGDPVCSPSDISELAQAFHHYCQEEKKRVIYLMASEPFAKWSMQHTCKSLVEFGEELSLNPQQNPLEKHGTHASLVRRKVRHALKEDVAVQEYLSQNTMLEREIEQVGMSWLKSRRGPQIHISRIYLFEDRLGKRWFYATHQDEIVGVVVLNQIQTKKGWLLNHLMIKPNAPHGTQELLVITALQALQREGCHFVSLGAVPATQLGEMTGLSPFSTQLTRWIYKGFYRFFRLDGLKTFWGKFDPKAERSYLLFSQPSIGFKEIRALMHSMNVSL